jgi:predicted HD phosphohydrolase
MVFTNLRDATREDWDRIDALDEARTDYSAAPLALLESLNGGDPAGYTLNPYDHSRQAATRALRAGESSQFIVSVLFHDAADRLAPANHGQIAAELLRPFVDDDHYWMVKMHGLFQKENFTHHKYWGSGVLDAMLDPYRDHPAFELTQRFCRDYDATSFDPGYDALPVEAFTPQIREVFERPYSFQA